MSLGTNSGCIYFNHAGDKMYQLFNAPANDIVSKVCPTPGDQGVAVRLNFEVVVWSVGTSITFVLGNYDAWSASIDNIKIIFAVTSVSPNKATITIKDRDTTRYTSSEAEFGTDLIPLEILLIPCDESEWCRLVVQYGSIAALVDGYYDLDGVKDYIRDNDSFYFGIWRNPTGTIEIKVKRVVVGSETLKPEYRSIGLDIDGYSDYDFEETDPPVPSMTSFNKVPVKQLLNPRAWVTGITEANKLLNPILWHQMSSKLDNDPVIEEDDVASPGSNIDVVLEPLKLVGEGLNKTWHSVKDIQIKNRLINLQDAVDVIDANIDQMYTWNSSMYTWMSAVHEWLGGSGVIYAMISNINDYVNLNNVGAVWDLLKAGGTLRIILENLEAWLDESDGWVANILNDIWDLLSSSGEIFADVMAFMSLLVTNPVSAATKIIEFMYERIGDLIDVTFEEYWDVGVWWNDNIIANIEDIVRVRTQLIWTDIRIFREVEEDKFKIPKILNVEIGGSLQIDTHFPYFIPNRIWEHPVPGQSYWYDDDQEREWEDPDNPGKPTFTIGEAFNEILTFALIILLAKVLPIKSGMKQIASLVTKGWSTWKNRSYRKNVLQGLDDIGDQQELIEAVAALIWEKVQALLPRYGMY
jgi:hypothetical protein